MDSAVHYGITHGFIDEECQPYTDGIALSTASQLKCGDNYQYCEDGTLASNRQKLRLVPYGCYNLVSDKTGKADVGVMQAEIIANGPIMAGLVATDELYLFRGGRVYEPSPAAKKVEDHAVVIIGFEPDGKGGINWICQNSWGVEWGDTGLVRIPAGRDVLGIESTAVVAVTPSVA